MHLRLLLVVVGVRAFAPLKTQAVQRRVGHVRSAHPCDFNAAKGKSVFRLDGSETSLEACLDDGPAVVVCLTHFGDFNAWEVTQQLRVADCGKLTPLLVGIGSVESARQFASDLDLSEDASVRLVADPTGDVASSLGCYKGWLYADEVHRELWPSTDVNPYVKLFGMIFGFGSPGTMGQVAYGYLGDASGPEFNRRWVVQSLLQGSRKGRFPTLTEDAFAGVDSNSGLRPFELATLRAQTGIHILRNWAKLGPKDGDMFTRMGGTFVFDEPAAATGDREVAYFQRDAGILAYTNVVELTGALSKLYPTARVSAID